VINTENFSLDTRLANIRFILTIAAQLCR